MLTMVHKNKRPKHGGSVFGREFLQRERVEAHDILICNYFIPTPIYPEKYFFFYAGSECLQICSFMFAIL